MDNKAQLSLEYLVLVAVALLLATVATILATDLFSIKESIKLNIEEFRNRMLQIS